MRGLLLAGVAALGWAASASASPISYTIQPVATTTLGRVAEIISGSFTYDASTFTEYLVAIVLTGGDPYDGLYLASAQDVSQLQADHNSNNSICADGNGKTVCLNFQSVPAGNAVALRTVSFGYNGPNGAAAAIDPAPSGLAVPDVSPAPIPEPMSLGLLGAALVAASSLRRRLRG